MILKKIEEGFALHYVFYPGTESASFCEKINKLAEP